MVQQQNWCVFHKEWIHLPPIPHKFSSWWRYSGYLVVDLEDKSIRKIQISCLVGVSWCCPNLLRTPPSSNRWFGHLFPLRRLMDRMLINKETCNIDTNQWDLIWSICALITIIMVLYEGGKNTRRGGWIVFSKTFLSYEK